MKEAANSSIMASIPELAVSTAECLTLFLMASLFFSVMLILYFVLYFAPLWSVLNDGCIAYYSVIRILVSHFLLAFVPSFFLII